MLLSKKQFDLLALLERRKGPFTQRELAKALGFSLGTVNQTAAALGQRGLLRDGRITEAGLAALEPYRVKRALILAAGFGSRLVPVTLTTPKPLVTIHGRRIIDSLLDALLDAGIREIHMVRGYLAGQFDQLLEKYPMIHFLDNPAYNETNNISSAMCVRPWMGNAYLCDADLLIHDPGVISRYQYQTNYIGIPVGQTDDWCLSVKNGLVTGMQLGSSGGYLMHDITYWDAKDGAQLARDVAALYEMPGGSQRFWDEAPLGHFRANYRIAVRPCAPGSVTEIDTYRELQALDSSYK